MSLTALENRRLIGMINREKIVQTGYFLPIFTTKSLLMTWVRISFRDYLD